MKKLNLPKRKIVEMPSGFLRRFLALIVDLIIINFIIVGPFKSKIKSMIPLGSYTETYDFFLSNQTAANSLYGMYFTIIVLAFAYFVLFEWKLAQTPGKMLFKIFVGGKISLSQAVIRNMDVIIFGIFFPVLVFDIGYGFFNKDRQRFLEKLSNSKTIERWGG